MADSNVTKAQKIGRGTYRADRDGPKPVQLRINRPADQRVVDKKLILAGMAKLRKQTGYDARVSKAGYKIDFEAAIKAVRFFENQLSHVKGEKARTPFMLELWQVGVIGNMFGWVNKKTRLRRYRQVLVFVGRKNGKTPLAAGIVNYLLFEDGEPGAEIYGAAAEYKQASLVFEHARGMVLHNEGLEARCKILSGQSKAIELQSDFSTYRVISSDAFSSHGYNTHGAVVDELHACPNGELLEVLETSVGARRQPLIIIITTSDFERPGSPCNEKHDYASKVRDGIIDDPTFFPVIYEATIEDDWTSPKVWRKANPNLGVSVSLEYIKSACKKAQEVPSFENTFRRLHLNIRTQQDVRWLVMDDWNACGDTHAVTDEDLAGQECWVGVDLSTTKDITAVVLYFPEVEHAVLPFFWVPADNARKRERRDKVPYSQWISEGWLTATPGPVVDYDRIRNRINELGEVYNIRSIAFDRWNSTQLQAQLEGDGFDVVAFGQGYASMTAPSKELEKLVLAGTLAHMHNPVLRWMASNALIDTDAAGNIKPAKDKSTEKIDGIVALIMGIGESMVSDVAEESVYESRGFTTA